MWSDGKAAAGCAPIVARLATARADATRETKNRRMTRRLVAPDAQIRSGRRGSGRSVRQSHHGPPQLDTAADSAEDGRMAVDDAGIFWWHSIELPDGSVTPGEKTPGIQHQEWE